MVAGHDASDKNINLQGAVLHVIGDLVQSLGVAVAGALIWWKQVCTCRTPVLLPFCSGISDKMSSRDTQDPWDDGYESKQPEGDGVACGRMTRAGTWRTRSAPSCLRSWCC